MGQKDRAETFRKDRRKIEPIDWLIRILTPENLYFLNYRTNIILTSNFVRLNFTFITYLLQQTKRHVSIHSDEASSGNKLY